MVWRASKLQAYIGDSREIRFTTFVFKFVSSSAIMSKSDLEVQFGGVETL